MILAQNIIKITPSFEILSEIQCEKIWQQKFCGTVFGLLMKF